MTFVWGEGAAEGGKLYGVFFGEHVFVGVVVA